MVRDTKGIRSGEIGNVCKLYIHYGRSCTVQSTSSFPIDPPVRGFGKFLSTTHRPKSNGTHEESSLRKGSGREKARRT